MMSGWGQMVHIVRKDVRHLWMEIVVSVGVVAMFAWLTPMTWPGFEVSAESSRNGLMGMFGSVVRGLIPLSWLLLIARVVQSEGLVGDRQFWVTRPYRWYALLGAKVVFVVGFCCVPLGLAQIYLMHHAGLGVRGFMPQLLGDMGMFGLVMLLPVMALATVTSGFGMLLLAALGWTVYCWVLTVSWEFLFVGRAMPPYGMAIGYGMGAVVLAGVGLLQFRERRVVLSRWILAGLPLALAVIVYVLPAGALFRLGYRGSAAAVGFKTAFSFADPTAPIVGERRQTMSDGMQRSRSMFVNLPIGMAGFPAGGRVRERAIQLEVSDGRGWRWTSPWQDVFGNASSDVIDWVGVKIPDDVAERLKSGPVHVRLALALSLVQSRAPQTLTVSARDQAAPFGGVCAMPKNLDSRRWDRPLACRFPPLDEREIQVTGRVRAGDCRQGPGAVGEASVSGMQWLWFDPVYAVEVSMRTAPPGGGTMLLGALCDGDQVQFVGSEEVAKVLVHVEKDEVNLSDYLVRGPDSGAMPPVGIRPRE